MARARVAILIAAVCFGTTGTAQALGPDATPVTVGAVRIALGALLLLLAQRLLRARSHTNSAQWPRGPQLVGAIGVAGYALSFFAAVKLTGVAIGTVVALGSAPALAGLGAWLIDRERPTNVWYRSTALAVAGVAMIALAGGGAEVDPLGVLLALGAGTSYAAYTLASKRMLEVGHRPEQVMARIFAFGAVLLIPVLVLGDISWLWSWSGVAMALWLAAIPTAFAYLLFAWGLKHLPAGEVATLTLGEPATAVLLGVVVLSERPGPLAIAGVAVVIAALVMIAVPQRTAQTG
ncbi:MAG TPA: DMT family transporter [Baekduia sp.]|mgnify:CR=1 FL=1|nr:DMT family transporter [Baekduia sp.]